jgi:hypothetical protein
VEKSRRRNAEKRRPDQPRAGLGEVDATGTKIFVQEWETRCLEVIFSPLSFAATLDPG